ncbi:MAG TPA: uroporphyrinogen decarboxylase family protein, partial [Fimbriimonadaceae bacterium]|nr:uroporphyrinogen decarboxylase family protein [Fimbriimonadaceae bacterium]
MTHRQRIEAVIRGEKADRIPVALWRHFPHDDLTADGLARAVIAFQKKFDFDIVKVTPASSYPAEAWGGKLEHLNNEEGTRGHIERVVKMASDWTGLGPQGLDNAVLARELDALTMVREGVGDDVHVLQTIFSPLTIGKQLAGEEMLARSMNDHGDELKEGLETVAETMARFTKACLERGADGIFFATQYA